MDGFITYNMPRKPRQNLMMPPPYLKKCDKPDDVNISEDLLRIQYTNPAKILLLCESLTDSTSRGLQKKINSHLKKETFSQCVFIMVLMNSEVFIHVIGEQLLETPKRFSIENAVVSAVLERRTAVESKVEELDSSLVDVIQQIVGKEGEITKDVFVVPVFPKCAKLRQDNDPVALLVCLINCPLEVTKAHHMVRETFRFCLPILMNTSVSEEETRLKTQCQALLNVARRLFNHLGDLNDLLKEIMSIAKTLTNAERCSLFLVDKTSKDLVAKVFDGQPATEDTPEVRISKDQGIAGHVAVTGKVINIQNAYEHPLFYQGVDEATGFRTRNILCFPIRDESSVVGVAQLCNKREGSFDRFDEEAAMAFSIYCGISIMHSLVYRQIKEAQVKSQLSNDLMLYHMKPYEYELLQVERTQINFAEGSPYELFNKFTFNPRTITEPETARYVVYMFEDLNLINTYKLDRIALVRFILYVQKAYRDTPYHNWMHAFTVTHFNYNLIKNLKLVDRKLLTELEVLSLIVSCLCHDVDHRGTTNSFQLKAQNELSCLYSSEGSVMERHHLSQSLCILNTPGCNFLENLDNRDYVQFLDMLRNNILSTDLAKHLEVLDQQVEMAQTYNRTNPGHKKLLLSLFMTCSDLCDQTKGWNIAVTVAQLIYDEFFKQGDLEKQIGEEPLEMMDREKASIPELQIQFLDDVCLPVFKVLGTLYPPTEIFSKIIEKNTECWERSKSVFEKYKEEGVSSLEVLMGNYLEGEVRTELGITASELFNPSNANMP